MSYKPSHVFTLLAAIAFSSTSLIGQEPSQPKAVPQNRADIKVALEQLKHRKPRLPLPLTKSADETSPSVNNARARAFFLPAEWFGGERPPQGSNAIELVDYELKTKCFWIVSRGNNCHYCLGHQEHKLVQVGLSDDDIAMLDHDWDSLDSRTRKAVTLARKMTLEPHLFNDADVEQLKPDFDDAEIIELVYTIARFNATNRWTDSLGLPQDNEMRGHVIDFASTTADRWKERDSLAKPDQEFTQRETPTILEIRQGLESSRTRSDRVLLADENKSRKVLELDPGAQVNDLHLAMAQLNSSAAALISNREVILQHEELSPKLKLQIMYLTALLNRSWFNVADAEMRLELVSFPASDLIDRRNSSFSEAEQIVFDFAEKLTVSPHLISDDDINQLRTHFTDRQTAQIVHVIAMCNSFDRFCEVLGLRAPLES